MPERKYKMSIAIAIDGPAGAGKSTIAKEAAKELGFIYVDTGALYRSIGLYVYRQNVDKSDQEKIIALLDDINVSLSFNEKGEQIVILNGEDVSPYIRTPEISMYASAVSSIPKVRAFLLETQRSIARENNVIMDGRDIGTVILPDAKVKIFLSASAEDRARRRYEELIQKGENVTYEEVLRDAKERDYNDSHRAAAPLKPADDAIMVDTTGQTKDESVALLINIMKENMQ